MEAPERIYCESDGIGNIVKVHNIKWPDDEAENIEYTRTDAFIEKACDFLRYYRQDTLDGTGYVAGVVNDKTIEAFKCYMKGE
jgi:hypothetical protein